MEDQTENLKDAEKTRLRRRSSKRVSFADFYQVKEYCVSDSKQPQMRNDEENETENLDPLSQNFQAPEKSPEPTAAASVALSILGSPVQSVTSSVHLLPMPCVSSDSSGIGNSTAASTRSLGLKASEQQSQMNDTTNADLSRMDIETTQTVELQLSRAQEPAVISAEIPLGISFKMDITTDNDDSVSMETTRNISLMLPAIHKEEFATSVRRSVSMAVDETCDVSLEMDTSTALVQEKTNLPVALQEIDAATGKGDVDNTDKDVSVVRALEISPTISKGPSSAPADDSVCAVEKNNCSVAEEMNNIVMKEKSVLIAKETDSVDVKDANERVSPERDRDVSAAKNVDTDETSHVTDRQANIIAPESLGNMNPNVMHVVVAKDETNFTVGQSNIIDIKTENSFAVFKEVGELRAAEEFDSAVSADKRANSMMTRNVSGLTEITRTELSRISVVSDHVVSEEKVPTKTKNSVIPESVSTAIRCPYSISNQESASTVSNSAAATTIQETVSKVNNSSVAITTLELVDNLSVPETTKVSHSSVANNTLELTSKINNSLANITQEMVNKVNSSSLSVPADNKSIDTIMTKSDPSVLRSPPIMARGRYILEETLPSFSKETPSSVHKEPVGGSDDNTTGDIIARLACNVAEIQNELAETLQPASPPGAIVSSARKSVLPARWLAQKKLNRSACNENSYRLPPVQSTQNLSSGRPTQTLSPEKKPIAKETQSLAKSEEVKKGLEKRMPEDTLSKPLQPPHAKKAKRRDTFSLAETICISSDPPPSKEDVLVPRNVGKWNARTVKNAAEVARGFAEALRRIEEKLDEERQRATKSVGAWELLRSQLDRKRNDLLEIEEDIKGSQRRFCSLELDLAELEGKFAFAGRAKHRASSRVEPSALELMQQKIEERMTGCRVSYVSYNAYELIFGPRGAFVCNFRLDPRSFKVSSCSFAPGESLAFASRLNVQLLPLALPILSRAALEGLRFADFITELWNCAMPLFFLLDDLYAVAQVVHSVQLRERRLSLMLNCTAYLLNFWLDFDFMPSCDAEDLRPTFCGFRDCLGTLKAAEASQLVIETEPGQGFLTRVIDRLRNAFPRITNFT